MEGFLYKKQQQPLGLVQWKKRYFQFPKQPVSDISHLAHIIRKTKTEDQVASMARALVHPQAMLMSFPSEADMTRPLDVINLRLVDSWEAIGDLKKGPSAFAIVIRFKTGKETVLCVPDETELNMWVKAFEEEHQKMEADTDEIMQAIDEALGKVKNAMKGLKKEVMIDMEAIDGSTEEDVSSSAATSPKDETILESVPQENAEASAEDAKDDEKQVQFEDVADVIGESAEKRGVGDMFRRLGNTLTLKRPAKAKAVVEEAEETIGDAAEEVAEQTPVEAVIEAVVEEILPAEPEPEDKEIDGFHVPKEAVHYGYLEKRSDYLKAWNKRFLIVTKVDGDEGGLKIAYFRPGHTAKPAGEVTVASSEKTEFGHGFGLNLIATTKQTWRLSAADEAERDLWLEKLTA